MRRCIHSVLNFISARTKCTHSANISLHFEEHPSRALARKRTKAANRPVDRWLLPRRLLRVLKVQPPAEGPTVEVVSTNAGRSLVHHDVLFHQLFLDGSSAGLIVREEGLELVMERLQRRQLLLGLRIQQEIKEIVP